MALVPQHVVDRVRKEYAEGGISMMHLAARYDIGETTAYRIINHLGAYKQVTLSPDMPSSVDIQASAERLLKMLSGELPPPDAKPVEEELPFAVPKTTPYY